MAWRPATNADFRALQDEVLIVLARYGCLAALDVLMKRHGAWMEGFIARRTGGRLKPDELPDAQQVGRLAFLEAVAKFDLFQAERRRRCSFRSYLGTKLRSRLDNFVRAKRRQKAHYVPAVQLDEELDRQAEKSHLAEKYDIWAASKLSDPALLAQRHECELRVAQAIGRLDSKYWQVWLAYSADKPIRQIAQEVGISISTVKRMLAVLKATVRAVVEEDLS